MIKTCIPIVRIPIGNVPIPRSIPITANTNDTVQAHDVPFNRPYAITKLTNAMKMTKLPTTVKTACTSGK